MPLHTQVDESVQDDELEINPVYVQELGSDQTKFGVKSMSKGEAYDQLGWKTV